MCLSGVTRNAVRLSSIPPGPFPGETPSYLTLLSTIDVLSGRERSDGGPLCRRATEAGKRGGSGHDCAQADDPLAPITARVAEDQANVDGADA